VVVDRVGGRLAREWLPGPAADCFSPPCAAAPR